MTASRRKNLVFDLDGRAVPVTLTRNRRARRLILRIDPRTEGAKLTLPWHVPEAEGLAFLKSQGAWLRRRLAKLPDRIPFAAGVRIPVLGEEHVIASRPEARGGVWLEPGTICVSGTPEHLPRRVGDWFRKEAKRRLAERAAAKADRLGVRVGRITVRDTTSRWGSCAHDGSLNFSWRLVMAPEFVFDFIVAHEVAHIVERNHGPGFHRLVAELTAEAERADAWLGVHGPALHRYG